MDMMKLQILTELLGTLFLTVIKEITACGRKVYSMPSQNEVTTFQPSTIPPSHRRRCTSDEESSIGCLNGGECYYTEIGGVPSVHCNCHPMFTGPRCQYFKPPVESRNFFTARTANMAAGLSVVLLLVIVIIIAVYVYIRLRRHKKNRDPSHPVWSEERVRGTSSEKQLSSKEVDESHAPLNGGASNNTHDVELQEIKTLPSAQHDT